MKKSKQKTSFDVVTIGGATQDIAYFSPESLVMKNPDQKDALKQKLLAFEYGTKIIMDDIYIGFGGGACNVAISFSRLGLRTACLLRVGQDNVGKQIKKVLTNEKIDIRYLQIDQKNYTGLSFIITSAGERDHTIFTYRGANTKLQISPNVIKKIKTKFYYVSSLSQKSWRKDLDNLLRYKKQARVAWNPGQLQLMAGKKGLDKYLKKTDVFNVNKDEAIELVASCPSNKNKSKSQLNNIRTLLKIMKNWGPKIIVITDGPRGACAYCNSEIFYEKASRVKLVDTTGAGDAFGAGFVAGLILCKADLKKSLHLGIANSASVVQKIGAQGGILNNNFFKKHI